MRLLDRLLKPTVDRLVAACIEEERRNVSTRSTGIAYTAIPPG
jgi:hypothetical protein